MQMIRICPLGFDRRTRRWQQKYRRRNRNIASSLGAPERTPSCLQDRVNREEKEAGSVRSYTQPSSAPACNRLCSAVCLHLLRWWLVQRRERLRTVVLLPLHIRLGKQILITGRVCRGTYRGKLRLRPRCVSQCQIAIGHPDSNFCVRGPAALARSRYVCEVGSRAWI